MMPARSRIPIDGEGATDEASLRLVEVQGSPFEMGAQHGEQSKHYVRGLLDALVSEIAKRRPITKAGLLAYTDPYIGMVHDELPDLAEEIRGIAAGAGVSEREIHLLHVQGEFRYRLFGGCSSLAVFTDGGVIVGQNFDLPAPFQEFVQLMHLRPNGKSPMLAFGLAGTLAHRGLNGAGLALVGNGLGGPEWRIGVSSILADRHALEQSSISAAVAAVRRLTRSKSANMLFADAKGQILDLETTPILDRAFGPTNGGLAHANHYSHHDLTGLERLLPGLEESPARVARLRDLLPAATLSVSEMQRVFSDHNGYPASICRHEPDGEGSHITVASIVAEPSRGVLHACRGNPCNASYRTYQC